MTLQEMNVRIFITGHKGQLGHALYVAQVIEDFPIPLATHFIKERHQ